MGRRSDGEINQHVIRPHARKDIFTSHFKAVILKKESRKEIGIFQNDPAQTRQKKTCKTGLKRENHQSSLRTLVLSVGIDKGVE